MNEYELFMRDCRNNDIWLDPEDGIKNGTGILTTVRTYTEDTNIDEHEVHKSVFHVFVNYKLVYRGTSLKEANSEYWDCKKHKITEEKK